MKKKILAIFLVGILLLVGLSNVSLGINACQNIDEECDLNPSTIYDFAECEIYIRPTAGLAATHHLKIPDPSGDYIALLKVEYNADYNTGWEYDGYWECEVYLAVKGNKFIFFDKKIYFKFDKNNEPEDVNFDAIRYIPPGWGEGKVRVRYDYKIKEDGITIDEVFNEILIPLSFLWFPREDVTYEPFNINPLLQRFLKYHPYMFPILRQLLGLKTTF